MAMRREIHRKEQAGAELSRPAPAPVRPGSRALQMQGLIGNRNMIRMLAAMKQGPSDERIRQAAQDGVQTSSGKLPFADRIQRSFGRHDVSGIASHTGSDASRSAQMMGAAAYATGNHVVFAGTPDLHTAAHEAAHIVQQRAGVQLAGGIGKVGDPYEIHADAVAAKVVRGESAEGLLDQMAGSGGSEAVQMKVHFSYSQWRGVTEPTKGNAKTYYDEFIGDDYRTAAYYLRGMDGLAEHDNLKDAYQTYWNTFNHCNSSGDWTDIVAPLDAMQTAVNNALTYVIETLQQKDAMPYSNTREDNWPVKGGIERMADISGRKADPTQAKVPGGAGQKNIPYLRWSEVKMELPSALRNLLRDIYHIWKLSEHMPGNTDREKTLDMRTDQQITDKTITSNNPGALRSWHVNQQGLLPKQKLTRQGGLSDPVPAHAQHLHNHYNATSQKPYLGYNGGAVGYAEYTGTGIKNDTHDSKVVLDYMTGGIYLTVTHYQLWTMKEDGKVETGGTDANSGTNSPWFYIDMTQ